MRQTEESKQFFFKKKNQKTFVYKALALPRRVGLMDKSFCSFFQKEVLSSCRCLSLEATWYYVAQSIRIDPRKPTDKILFVSFSSDKEESFLT
jgi:hypothetical protein